MNKILQVKQKIISFEVDANFYDKISCRFINQDNNSPSNTKSYVSSASTNQVTQVYQGSDFKHIFESPGIYEITVVGKPSLSDIYTIDIDGPVILDTLDLSPAVELRNLNFGDIDRTQGPIGKTQVNTCPDSVERWTMKEFRGNGKETEFSHIGDSVESLNFLLARVSGVPSDMSSNDSLKSFEFDNCNFLEAPIVWDKDIGADRYDSMNFRKSSNVEVPLSVANEKEPISIIFSSFSGTGLTSNETKNTFKEHMLSNRRLEKLGRGFNPGSLIQNAESTTVMPPGMRVVEYLNTNSPEAIFDDWSNASNLSSLKIRNFPTNHLAEADRAFGNMTGHDINSATISLNASATGLQTRTLGISIRHTTIDDIKNNATNPPTFSYLGRTPPLEITKISPGTSGSGTTDIEMNDPDNTATKSYGSRDDTLSLMDIGEDGPYVVNSSSHSSGVTTVVIDTELSSPDTDTNGIPNQASATAHRHRN